MRKDPRLPVGTTSVPVSVEVLWLETATNATPVQLRVRADLLSARVQPTSLNMLQTHLTRDLAVSDAMLLQQRTPSREQRGSGKWLATILVSGRD